MVPTRLALFLTLVILKASLTCSQRDNGVGASGGGGSREEQDVVTPPSSPSSSSSSGLWNKIEGKVIAPMDKKSNDWLVNTQILVNGGEFVGLLKEDGTFMVDGLPPGSFVLEVIHPQFQYESARVDITSKGKLRARKVNYIQPALVTHLPYPLRLNPVGPYKYFIPREQWRITDVLLSPMVLMMVLPLVLILILPKLMSDPETRKEMEAMQMPKYEMPEMSEMLTSFFGGGSSSPSSSDDRRKIKSKKNN